MKIIFLDMDGVLCTNRAHTAQGLQHMPNHHPFMDALDREAIGMLNALTAQVYCKYVLSSTWRKQHSKEEMEEHLRKYGWKGEFHEDWKTDHIGPIRGNEIQRWIDSHTWDNGNKNYIILDDNDDMLGSQKFHFVQTDEYNGLTMENYWHMERIFRHDPNIDGERDV